MLKFFFYINFIKKVQNGLIDITLFEYDLRFKTKYLSMFVHYDYKYPLNVPEELKGSFDIIIADPPFISEECLVKIAQTIRLLSKTTTKLIICSGSVLNEFVKFFLFI